MTYEEFKKKQAVRGGATSVLLRTTNARTCCGSGARPRCARAPSRLLTWHARSQADAAVQMELAAREERAQRARPATASARARDCPLRCESSLSRVVCAARAVEFRAQLDADRAKRLARGGAGGDKKARVSRERAFLDEVRTC